MSLNFSPTTLVEQLFLDLPIQQVLHDTTFVEPWKSMYVDAIRDGRFGDAVWARYHIYGDVVIIPGVDDPAYNMTTIEVIKEDALGYRVNAPEEYFKALAFYSTTSAADGHTDVIEVIANLSEEEIAEFKAKQEAEEEAGATGWVLLS
ncbi:hypothetical protein BJX63DRAFT_407676 [Aspergillus granulosus]|uniref:Uncharacterized protein n=1 Tax=Aspergillus granulosus TaxID=176169 RepID=A0ABR4H054_9EURO